MIGWGRVPGMAAALSAGGRIPAIGCFASISPPPPSTHQTTLSTPTHSCAVPSRAAAAASTCTAPRPPPSPPSVASARAARWSTRRAAAAPLQCARALAAPSALSPVREHTRRREHCATLHCCQHSIPRAVERALLSLETQHAACERFSNGTERCFLGIPSRLCFAFFQF